MSLVLLALVSLPLPKRCEAQTTPVAPPKVGGYVQVREVAQEQVGLTASLNRARASFDGALPSKFSYRMLVEFEAAAGA